MPAYENMYTILRLWHSSDSREHDLHITETYIFENNFFIIRFFFFNYEFTVNFLKSSPNTEWSRC